MPHKNMPNSERQALVKETLDYLHDTSSLENYTDKFNTMTEAAEDKQPLQNFVINSFRWVHSYEILFFILDNQKVNDETKKRCLTQSSVGVATILERMFHNTEQSDDDTDWNKLLGFYKKDLSSLQQILSNKPKSVLSPTISIMDSMGYSTKVPLDKRFNRINTICEILKSDPNYTDLTKQILHESNFKSKLSSWVTARYHNLNISSLEECIFLNTTPWRVCFLNPKASELVGINDPVRDFNTYSPAVKKEFFSDIQCLLSFILKSEAFLNLSTEKYPEINKFYEQLKLNSEEIQNQDFKYLTHEQKDEIIKELKIIQQKYSSVNQKLVDIATALLGILAFITIVPAIIIEQTSKQGFAGTFFPDKQPRNQALQAGINVLSYVDVKKN